jgi:hypothetical protein
MEEHALRLKVRAANVTDDTQYVLSNGVPDARYEIATIERKFGDMDIALTQLKPGMTGEMEVILCSKVVVDATTTTNDNDTDNDNDSDK